MMNIFERYIAKAVASSAVVVMLVLLTLFSFASMVAELGDVGRGDYGLMQAAQYVVLSLPRLGYQLFPIVALLGSVLGLGVLASNNELTAMRAAGLSLSRIGWAVMKVGLLLVALAVAMGELVAPPAEEYASSMRSTAIAGRYALPTKNGLWARDGGRYIHIRDALPDGAVGGVTVYEFDAAHHLRTVTQAKSGHYDRGGWVLQDVARSELEADAVRTQRQPQMSWQSSFTPELVSVVAVNPEALTFLGLYRYVHYLHTNGLNAERYELALWNKVAAPFTTAVMVLLAIPFVFGPLRSVGVGQRILVGALAGIGFHLINKTFNYAGLVYGLHPVLSAMLPTVLCVVAAYVLMRRVR